MALSADAKYNRRGQEPTRNEFGYPPTVGAVIYAGALVGLTAAGTVQPVQTAGTVVFHGLATGASGTPGQPAPLPYVVGGKGTYGILVPAATVSNINQPVYATDDSTLTLSSTTGSVSNLQVGTFVGIDAGLTYVNLLGS